MSFFPTYSPIIAAPAALTSISFVTSATSTAATITGPAGIQAGDLIILADNASGAAAADVVPTGFTRFATGTPAVGRMTGSYKLADGSEASASLTGLTSSTMRKQLLVFRGNIAAASLSVSTPNSQFTLADPSSQVVLAGAITPPLVVLGLYMSTGTPTPSFSPSEDATVGAGTTTIVRYKIYNSSPANTTVDMTDAGVNGLISASVRMI